MSIEYKQCETCGREFGVVRSDTTCPYSACPSNVKQSTGQWRYRYRNQQVGDNEATAIAIHPVTGEKVYCFDSPDREMPEHYRKEGFVKHQFKSFRELQKFCKDNGVVNDIEYGNKHDGYSEEMARVRRHREEEKRDMLAAYQRAREQAERG